MGAQGPRSSDLRVVCGLARRGSPPARVSCIPQVVSLVTRPFSFAKPTILTTVSERSDTHVAPKLVRALGASATDVATRRHVDTSSICSSRRRRDQGPPALAAAQAETDGQFAAALETASTP